MSFSIKFYTNSTEENRVNKTNYITLVETLTGDLREQCSLVTPTITIEKVGVPNFNYCYIEDFGRYYFIRNITSTNKNLWRLDLDCDVLMSYKDTILTQTALVERSASNFNKDIIDEQLSVELESDITIEDISVNNTFVDGTDYYTINAVKIG